MPYLKRLAVCMILGALVLGTGGCFSYHSHPHGGPPGHARKGGMPPGHAKKHHHHDHDGGSVSVGVEVELGR